MQLSDRHLTIAEVMAEKGRTTGFDHLRLMLAGGVVVLHSFILSQGHARGLPAWFINVAPLLLPGFFALSGFLVAGSLTRAPSLRAFLLLRALRIVPALALLVAITALAMGPLLSTHGVFAYFASPAWIAYFGNILGAIHFGLPGVFESNPRGSIVNGSLWTIPLEAACYILLAGIALMGMLRYPRYFFTSIMALSVGFAVIRPAIPGLLAPDLILFFLAGAAFYGVRSLIPVHGLLCLVCLVVVFLLVQPGEALYGVVMPLAYAIIWLGLRVLPPLPGDYSYGLYLSAYPLQQLYTQLFPDFRLWWLNTAFALVVGLTYAAISWHLLETRALKARERWLNVSFGRTFSHRQKHPANCR